MANNFDPDAYIAQKSGFDPDAYLAQKQNTSQAEGFMQGLTTNLPTKGFMSAVGRAALPIAGSTIGTIGGAGLASVPGAAAGGAAGEAIRQAIVSSNEPYQKRDLQDVAGRVALQGAGQGVAQAIGVGIGKLASKAVPVIAQGIRAMTGIPEKYGQAALKVPQILTGAASKDEMSTAYQAFEQTNGLKGLAQQIEESGRAALPSTDLEKMVVETANKVKNGAQVTPQELYSASQAASHLKLAARYGEPGAARAIESGIINRGKDIVDSALEESIPGYRNLRTSNFESKAAGAFSSLFPLNKNMSPNVLRSAVPAVLGAEEFIRTGDPRRAALPLAFSPAVYGAAIRSGPLMGNVASIANKAIGSMTMDEIYQYLRGKQENETP